VIAIDKHSEREIARIAVSKLRSNPLSVLYSSQEHVIVSLVSDCYSRDVVTLRESQITTEAGESMAPNTSIVSLGCKADYLVEVDDEQPRDTHLIERHEASYRSSRSSFKADDGAHVTQTILRTEGQQGPSRIDEETRDRVLRFRDDWVRNRAWQIRQAGSSSFHTCSEDTASITALNEFYRWRVFESFMAEQHRDKRVSGIGIMQGPRNIGSFPKEIAAAEKVQMCGIVCREKSRRVFRKTCR
jgi:hypothetical protein